MPKKIDGDYFYKMTKLPAELIPKLEKGRDLYLYIQDGLLYKEELDRANMLLIKLRQKTRVISELANSHPEITSEIEALLARADNGDF